jgi:hypothetical protein
MSKFKFKINDVFFIKGNMISMAGEMLPKDFPHVFSHEYKMKLMQDDKVLHNFKIIGEEIFARLPGAKRVRGLRTTDNIKDLLTNNDIKTLYILGEEREDNKKDDSKGKKEEMTTWQKRFNK